jgi:hypothetical protein
MPMFLGVNALEHNFFCLMVNEKNILAMINNAFESRPILLPLVLPCLLHLYLLSLLGPRGTPITTLLLVSIL